MKDRFFIEKLKEVNKIENKQNICKKKDQKIENHFISKATPG